MIVFSAVFLSIICRDELVNKQKQLKEEIKEHGKNM